MMGWNWDGGSWAVMGLGMLVWLVVGVIVVWLVVRGLIALERPRTEGRTSRIGGPSGPIPRPGATTTAGTYERADRLWFRRDRAEHDEPELNRSRMAGV